MFSYQYPRAALTVDCVVFGFDEGELKVLLIERGLERFKGKWALPGGFVRVEETLDKVIPILDSCRDPVLGFRDVLARIPNLTSRFRTANRATLSQLDELVAALAVISDRAQSISARLKASHDSAN